MAGRLLDMHNLRADKCSIAAMYVTTLVLPGRMHYRLVLLSVMQD